MLRHSVASALLLLAACGSSADPVSGAGTADGSGASGTGTGTGSSAPGGDGGTGSGLTDDAGNALCEVIQVDSGRVRPEMLIVLDRSSSMRSNGVDRWAPSVSGIKAITSSLNTRVDFGLMAFPGRGTATAGAGQSCAAGTVEVPVAPNAAGAISSSLDGLQLVQTTPTAASLVAAKAALASTNDDLDNKTLGGKYVVLVTDGAPNCANGVSGGGQGGAPDPVAVDATVAAITDLKAAGIQTYVLGFGTKADPVLAAALDRMAQAGGTSDTSHRAIEDEAQIVSEFQRIAGTALTCELTLGSPPEDPSFVAVSIDGKLVGLNDPNGWVLSADRARITFQGNACTLLKDPAGDHAVSVEVRCTKVILG